MKKLFALTLLTLSTLTMAGEKYICREIIPHSREILSYSNDMEYGTHKMILTQVGNEAVTEGKTHAFKLEIYQGNSATPLFVEAVNVRTEDVNFHFTNTARKISGHIFLDELDQSSLRIGNVKMNFDCN